MFVHDYNCITAAGFGANQLMGALLEGRECSTLIDSPTEWPQKVLPGGRVCFIESSRKKTSSYANHLQTHFDDLWKSLVERLEPAVLNELKTARVGLLFASTKGCIEDFVWNSSEPEIRQHADPFTVVTEGFTKTHPELHVTHTCNISNACSSSHVALEYAEELFATNRLDYVLLLAGDLIGPFIYNGFNSLKVLSQTKNKPFAADRDGLQLGDAAAMILLSREKKSSRALQIGKAASDTEGSSITRPSMNGQGLLRAIQQVTSTSPDLVIAHGTGTRFNDLAEDLALSQFQVQAPVTNTKWCTGHTLGASGAIDLIAGCEVLKSQRLFAVNSTAEKDSSFKMNYLLKGTDLKLQKPIQNILISSLGFGGVHAALILSQGAPS